MQQLSAVSPAETRKGKSIRKKFLRQKWLFLMLLPAFLTLVFFYYAPLSGWYVAFSEYKLGQPLFGGEYVGLKYFMKIIEESSDVKYLITNTLAMNGMTLFVNIFAALAMAILLNEMRWKAGAKAVQTVIFFPYFISWVITYALATALFAVNTGVVNQVLVKTGVLTKGLNILGDPKYSWGLIVFLNMWKFTGYNTIIFLSALAGIPHEEYEAATLDGAGRFQRIRHITMPHLLPTASVLLVMNSGYILTSNLDQFFVFNNTTNWSKMEVLDMYIYKFGLKMLDFPYATAMSIVKTLVSIALLLVVNRITKKLNDTAVI